MYIDISEMIKIDFDDYCVYRYTFFISLSHSFFLGRHLEACIEHYFAIMMSQLVNLK